MFKFRLIRILALVVLACSAPYFYQKYQSTVVASASATTSYVVDGQEYCARVAQKRHRDGSSFVRLENCSDTDAFLMVYDTANENPVKHFNFAPHGYAEFDIDSDHRELSFAARINNKTIPLIIELNV